MFQHPAGRLILHLMTTEMTEGTDPLHLNNIQNHNKSKERIYKHFHFAFNFQKGFVSYSYLYPNPYVEKPEAATPVWQVWQLPYLGFYIFQKQVTQWAKSGDIEAKKQEKRAKKPIT